MASLRTPALRHALSRLEGPLVRVLQRRWAQVHDVRFVTTHQPPSQKIFEKYREKLDKKAKEVGAKDTEELKRVFLEKNKPAASTTSTSSSPSPYPQPRSPLPVQPATTSPDSRPSPVPKSSSTPPGIKTLSSFLDLPKTRALPPKEIESLWRLRHASSPRSLCASIPQRVYQKISETARRHPQFILPLPAREGQEGVAEIHFLQWTFPTPETATVLFTHLAEYKLRGEYSQPHTTVTHHLELAEEKGLVLLQGSVMEDRGISVDEGRWLLMCLQKFYGMEEKEERGRLLRQFSSGDGEFKVENLLEEAEKLV